MTFNITAFTFATASVLVFTGLVFTGCSSDATDPAGEGGSADVNGGSDSDSGSGGTAGSNSDPDSGGGDAGSSSDPDGGSGGASSDPDDGGAGSPSSGACDSASCLQAEGIHNGVAFDFGCVGGELGFSPSSTENVVVPNMVTYDGVCGDGVNSDGFGTTYNVHLAVYADAVDTLTVGTYELDPATTRVDNVGITLQVTKSPAAQMSETSPNFVGATLTITAHEPRVMVEGTFTGSWGEDFTVDPHAAYAHSQLCSEWEGTGCDVPTAETVPAACICTGFGPFVTGEVSGTFKWEF